MQIREEKTSGHRQAKSRLCVTDTHVNFYDDHFRTQRNGTWAFPTIYIYMRVRHANTVRSVKQYLCSETSNNRITADFVPWAKRAATAHQTRAIAALFIKFQPTQTNPKTFLSRGFSTAKCNALCKFQIPQKFQRTVKKPRLRKVRGGCGRFGGRRRREATVAACRVDPYPKGGPFSLQDLFFPFTPPQNAPCVNARLSSAPRAEAKRANPWSLGCVPSTVQPSSSGPRKTDAPSM